MQSLFLVYSCPGPSLAAQSLSFGLPSCCGDGNTIDAAGQGRRLLQKVREHVPRVLETLDERRRRPLHHRRQSLHVRLRKLVDVRHHPRLR